MMSHELRTPLSTIIGFAEMIEQQAMGPVGNAKYSAYAADIRESGQHLLGIINDILDLSKVEAGKETLHEQEVDSTAVISGVRILRSEEHTSELQSLMRNSYAVFCLKIKKYFKQLQDNNQYTNLIIH